MAEKHYPPEIQLFMLRRFACYDTPSEVQRAVEEEFGVTIPISTVQGYDASKDAGRKHLSEEKQKFFWECRDKFQRGLDDVGIVHKYYRLRRLDEMERGARSRGDFELALKLHRQAAEEMGGMFDRSKNSLTLEAFQKEMERLAAALVKHVKDPDVLRAIEAEWGGEVPKEETTESRIREGWAW